MKWGFLVTLKHQNIGMDSEIKMLGYLFNCHMLWYDHIQHITPKLLRVMGIPSKFTFFLPQDARLLVHNALF